MIEMEKSDTVRFWNNQIVTYEREFGPWQERSRKIVKRYKDEREGSAKSKAQFNVLWSNVQTLAPALYAKNPVPNVDRRFEDDDKLGTVSAKVLERATTYFVDTDLFNNVMKQAVLDRLLPGRGSAWARYVPNFKDVQLEGTDEIKQEGVQTTDDTVKGDESPEQELYSEDVVFDYVHWQDFGHTWGRTWEEVRAVWRKVYLTRKEMERRGFKDWDKVPLEETKKDDKTISDEGKKATVYEIWDRVTKKVYWVHKSMKDVLDERDDPLGLKEFFPCPKPIFATLANDNLIPVPDYIQYQDQAKELDDLTGRINSIVRALKVAGVYDSSATGVQRLLSEGVENTLIPIEQWALFGEKGGLKGVMDFLPIKEIVEVLASLYEAREKAKQDLYEITGISDIIRGSTDPRETLGAQELKGKYAGLRLDNMQGDVARFSRDLVRITAEIVAEHFSLETIQQISGVKLLTQDEKNQYQLAAQSGQALPEGIQELLDNPTWEDVHNLIKNDTLRCFRITIETDSTIKADQDAEKEARVEFLTAAGSFIQQATQVPNIELQPLLMEMLMFGIRGFKVGRDMESTFEVALKKIREKAENPPEAPPDPEMQKLQAQMQMDGQKLQIEGQKLESENATKGQELQLTAQKTQAEIALKNRELDIKEAELQLKAQELRIKELELQARVEMEGKKLESDERNNRMQAKVKASPDVALTDKDMNPDVEVTPMAQMMNQLAQTLSEGLSQIAMITQQGNQAVIEAVSRPKTIIRDKNNQIAGVQ